MKAIGTFEVSMNPLAQSEVAGSSLGRWSLEKKFVGDMVGTGTGEVLTAQTKSAGSAAYVAIEHITVGLQGRNGSFVFQHSATMAGGSQRMSITAVPDSGTAELVGISGTFTITIVDAIHRYEFEYSLP